ncbi:MAG: glucose-1-phosphate adenylyltransferase [Synergistaceae bacterium]|jgi:glucose-1-phosphate adenylyltransferase|nr:glucose-1-phosphate adenylyltransferase [Synergistaceae bacterium]
MKKEECIAMVFAGGKGAGLGALTNCLAKPALFFGGGHRIIDFALNNCRRSGWDIVGVLTRYSSRGLASYVEDKWDLSRRGEGAFMPFMLCPKKSEEDYLGTVDAVYRNIEFIESFSPKYVCVLPGDHICKMDYAKMLDAHKRNEADVTVAAVPALFSGTCRYGNVKTDEKGTIFGFGEDPMENGLVSMGAYIFNWDALRKYLTAEGGCGKSPKDLGKDILPAMLYDGNILYAYWFDGCWRDVETVEALWKSNMDLLHDPSEFVVEEKGGQIFTSFCSQLSYFFAGKTGTIDRSILSGLHVILGKVEHSVLSDSIVVESGAEVVDSVLMPNVYVGQNAKIYKTVVGPNAKIMNDVEIGMENGIADFVSDRFCTNGVSLVAPGVYIAECTKLRKNSYIEKNLFADDFKFHATHLDHSHRKTVPSILLKTAI